MTTANEHAYISVGTGSICYRRWGDTGPILIALHGSPQSSKALSPLASHARNNGYQVIAFDTPGNGLSDPIGQIINKPDDAITIEDYADVLAMSITALGIVTPAIYGFHTGAAIACVFAAKYPNNISNLICEGLPAWTDEERQSLLKEYLPPFKPEINGAHMCWLWSRMENQSVFFPWNIRSNAQRLEMDPRPSAFTHALVMDMLDAGEHYALPYQSAFDFKLEEWVNDIQCPRLFIALKADPLSQHLKRKEFTDEPIATFSKPDESYNAIVEQLKQTNFINITPVKHLGNATTSIQKGWIVGSNFRLAYTGNILSTQQSNYPLVLLHSAGGAMYEFDSYIETLAQHRPVIALDLSGHGESEKISDEPSIDAAYSIDDFAHEISAALTNLNITKYAVAGNHFGGKIAAWLVKNHNAIAAATIGLSTTINSANNSKNTMQLQPEWDGAHLVRAFRIAYWESLFYPWHDRCSENRIELKSGIDAKQVHQRAHALLKSNRFWRHAVEAQNNFVIADELAEKDNFTIIEYGKDPKPFAKTGHKNIVKAKDESELIPLLSKL